MPKQSHINTLTLLQYRSPYPYRSPLRNLISSISNPPSGFTVYKHAIINQNGYNLIRSRLSSIASILWSQEPANVKLHYCNLARKIRKIRTNSTNFARRNNNIRRISQHTMSQQNPPVPPAPTVPTVPPAPPVPVTRNNTSDIYFDFEELASHMNQGIPLSTPSFSVFNVSSSFGTSFN
ncbi:hypothetical protein RclHR1_00490040 [Rhizophagus clarus]|uniref:HMG box domain-containing protein n=1 Tax=Rhizophagus clarus TaxID=94130 RepID=A0A2Z6RKW1_9GLOM|nr:hypothetical protein RclHR1_00490040 [Rhizophagus clarus]GES80609.1 hypothetical protein GLOIN_2v1482051 [Rhizophagus clarus]